MNFGLDYLSAHLDSKGYNFVQFENEAKSPVFNQETGDIYNSKIPRANYRADVHYNDVVIGAHSGGQYNFAEIVSREGLKVTRVDLKVDCTGKELFSEECTHIEAFQLLKRKITNYFLKEGRRVQCNDYGIVSTDKNSPRGCTFGARGSEYQVRIYTKLVSEKPLVRIEFQLRKELARTVWEAIKDDLYEQSTLARAFFSVEATILTKGLLGLPFELETSNLRTQKEQQPSNRKLWFDQQVLPAALKEFKESGENLPEYLLMRFNQYFETLRQANESYDKLTERVAAAERLFSE